MVSVGSRGAPFASIWLFCKDRLGALVTVLVTVSVSAEIGSALVTETVLTIKVPLGTGKSTFTAKVTVTR